MVKKWLQAVFLFALAVHVSGCAALLVGGAVGAAGVIWAKGKLQEQVEVPLSRAHKATINALKKLELSVLEERKDLLSAKIHSQFADGKRIWIDIRSLTESSCIISIRVGSLGDKYRSQKILETIRKYL